MSDYDSVRAETLREAADAWTQGAWADVMLPKPDPSAVPVIAYSNRVGDWLRNRAASIEEERADDSEYPSPDDLLGADPEWTGGVSVDEYMNRARRRPEEER